MNPTITFNPCLPQVLEDYIDQFIVTNHNNEITAEQHNNIENGLLTFILSSFRNYNKAYVTASAAAFVANCNQCILIFKAGAIGSIQLMDNRWNEWVIYNNSGSNKQLVGTISSYRTQKGLLKNYVTVGSVLKLAKGVDNIWYQVDNGIPSSGSAKTPLTGVVDRGGGNDPVSGVSTFQNINLIGLADANNGDCEIQIDGSIQYSYGNNASFTLDSVLGILDISPNVFVPGSAIYIDLNQ